MRSQSLMAWANIKKKKGETFLIALTILVSIIAMEVSMGLLSGLHRPFETMAAQTNAPHIMVFYNAMKHATPAMITWFEAQPETEEVVPPAPIFQTSSDTVSGDRKLEKSLMLTEDSAPGRHAFRVLNSLSHPAPAALTPGPGEIWVPLQFAKAKNLKLGDSIGFPTSAGMQQLQVTAFVLDPYFSTSNISPTRCWVRSGALLEWLPLSGLDTRYLGVRLKDAAETAAVETRFKSSFSGDLEGWTLTYPMAKLAYGIFLNILSVALLIVALMALFIAVSMMAATITSAIYANYKNIGILKAQGFTPRNITTVFMGQYLLIGAVCLPLGMVIGMLITQGIFQSIAQSMGLSALGAIGLLPLIAPAVIVFCVLVLGSWFASRRAGKVPPMQAIRFGAPVTHTKATASKRLWVQNLSPRLLIAFRQATLNPKRTLFAGMGLVLTTFVLVFSVNIAATFGQLAQNKALWGDSASHLSVTLTQKRFTIKDEQFRTLIANHPAIATVLPTRSLEATIPNPDQTAGTDHFGHACDGDMDALGFINLQGRNPQTSQDIALGVNTAKNLNLNLGDPVELFVEGQRLNFQLCGIFQTASNFGQGFRIQASALKEFIPDYRAGSFAILLKDPSQASALKEELKQRFSEAVSISTSEEEQEEMDRIFGGMNVSLAILSLVLLGIVMVMLVNDTLLSIVEHRKTFGILKTLGMTPKDLRAALALKAVLISALALALGLPMALILIPKLLSLVAGGIGLVQFPITVNLVGTLLIVPLLTFFAFAATWLGSKSVTQVQPRLLISQ